jgi:hypothetical protein
MLRNALTFPTRGRRGPISVLIGGVLVFLRWGLVAGTVAVASVALTVEGGPASAVAAGGLAVVALPLVVVELALRGYRIRALRAVVADPDADAPGFGRPGTLLRDGLLGVGVTVGYLLPGAVLLWVAALGIDAVPAMAPTPPSLADAVARNLAGLALLFGLLELVGAAYLLPAAAASAAHDRSIRAAFGRRVVAGAFSEDYAVGWVAAGLLALVVFPALLLVSSLVVVPLLAAPFGSFFVAVAIRQMYGAGFGAAAGLAAEPTGAGADAAGSRAPAPAVDRTDPDDGAARTGRDLPDRTTGRGTAPDDGGADPATDRSSRSEPADRQDAGAPADEDPPGSPADPMADEFRE